jgi:hypothetical protein
VYKDKPKKYVKRVIQIQPSSTTEEVIKKVIKPKRFEKKEIHTGQNLKDLVKTIRIKEKKVKKLHHDPNRIVRIWDETGVTELIQEGVQHREGDIVKYVSGGTVKIRNMADLEGGLGHGRVISTEEVHTDVVHTDVVHTDV